MNSSCNYAWPKMNKINKNINCVVAHTHTHTQTGSNRYRRLWAKNMYVFYIRIHSVAFRDN